MTIISLFSSVLFLLAVDRKVFLQKKSWRHVGILWLLYAAGVGISIMSDLDYPIGNPSGLIKTAFQPLLAAVKHILE